MYTNDFTQATYGSFCYLRTDTCTSTWWGKNGSQECRLPRAVTQSIHRLDAASMSQRSSPSSPLAVRPKPHFTHSSRTPSLFLTKHKILTGLPRSFVGHEEFLTKCWNFPNQCSSRPIPETVSSFSVDRHWNDFCGTSLWLIEGCISALLQTNSVCVI